MAVAAERRANSVKRPSRDRKPGLGRFTRVLNRPKYRSRGRMVAHLVHRPPTAYAPISGVPSPLPTRDR